MRQREKAVWRAIRFSAIAIAVLLIGAMVYTGIRAPGATSSPTPTKTPTAVSTQIAVSTPTATAIPSATSTVTVAPAASGAALPTETAVPAVASTALVTASLTVPATAAPTPLPSPTSVPSPTATSWVNRSPLILHSPLPAPTLLSTTVAPLTLYVCGYDRCRDSSEYGKLSFDGAISVWQNHEPDRGEVVRELFHGDEVQVVAMVLVHNGPGGLWVELAAGGWISEMWLTEEICTADNLDNFSFERCASDED